MVVDVKEVRKLDAYLKRVFSNPLIRVVPHQKKNDSADVFIGDELIAVLFVDDEDGDHSYQFEMSIKNLNGVGKLDPSGVRKLDAHLKKVFGNPKIRAVPRQKKNDSADVFIGDEFIAVLFVDDDNSYQFEMSILEEDLADQA